MLRRALTGRGQGAPPQWREYRYRQLFGLTHEQYLCEPAETVDWMLAVDAERIKAEREASGG